MTAIKTRRRFPVYLWLAGVLAVLPACAEDTDNPTTPAQVAATTTPPDEVKQPPSPRYKDAEVSARMVMRTPDQLRAFYIGREFNPAAIDKILETCFITPIIHNKTLDVLWLELDTWEFRQGDRVIPRLDRGYWPDKWREAGLPQAQRSTFWWTLMPEVRDLRLDEGVGGSVVIPLQDKPFSLTMRFHTGADKQGPVKTVVFEDLICVGNTP